MGEIIDLSEWRSRHGERQEGIERMRIGSPRRPQYPAGSHAIGREEAERISRAVIEERAKEHPKMDGTTRITVAKNLYEIVQEAKAKGVKMRAVVPKALDFEDEVLPTKRLWWYTLRPDRQEDASVKKLRKNTKGYVRLAQEIATALAPQIGDDKNYFLRRLFRGTKYADDPSEAERRMIPIHVARLEDDLRDMVEGIAHQYELNGYFARLWEEQVPAEHLDPEKRWVGSGRVHPYSVLLPPKLRAWPNLCWRNRRLADGPALS